MNWSDYEAVWKRQAPPVGAHADLTMLKETFETKSRKQAASLRVRDYLEAGAGIFVVIAYSRFWHKVGAQGWPMALAIGIVLVVTLFFLRERLRAHRNRQNQEAPISTKILADLVELRHQRRLLLTVWAWYLSPLTVAMLIHSTVIKQIHPNRGGPHYISFLIISASLFLLAWWLNRRAVRKNIEPRIAELEKLQRDLQDTENLSHPL